MDTPSPVHIAATSRSAFCRRLTRISLSRYPLVDGAIGVGLTDPSKSKSRESARGGERTESMANVRAMRAAGTGDATPRHALPRS